MSKYKICHVTSVHPSTDVRIFWKECISLSKRYEVCLIAPNTTERDEHGIHIYNVDLPKGRLNRQWHLGKVYDKMIEINADVYHFHDPELMRLGAIIKRYGKKVIFDSHEDVPMQILCKEYIPDFAKMSISKLYSFYENKLLRKFDALISVTPTIIERLRLINANTFMVTNYPVLSEFQTVNTLDRGGGIFALQEALAANTCMKML